MRREFDHRQGSSICEKGMLFEHGQENCIMRRDVLLLEGSWIDVRKF